MKRVFIVHGWYGSPNEDWFVWLKRQVGGSARVHILPMPDPASPKITPWVATLARAVGKPDKDTFFVGHSIGCQTILRYLTKHPSEIGGAVLVAPWFTLKAKAMPKREEKAVASPWLTKEIDIHPLHARKFFALFSADDPYVPLSNMRTFRRLGATVAMQKRKGHFWSPEDGMKTIPVVRKELMRMMR